MSTKCPGRASLGQGSVMKHSRGLVRPCDSLPAQRPLRAWQCSPLLLGSHRGCLSQLLLALNKTGHLDHEGQRSTCSWESLGRLILWAAQKLVSYFFILFFVFFFTSNFLVYTFYSLVSSTSPKSQAPGQRSSTLNCQRQKTARDRLNGASLSRRTVQNPSGSAV